MDIGKIILVVALFVATLGSAGSWWGENKAEAARKAGDDEKTKKYVEITNYYFSLVMASLVVVAACLLGIALR